jgi:hypothetical protein
VLCEQGDSVKRFFVVLLCFLFFCLNGLQLAAISLNIPPTVLQEEVPEWVVDNSYDIGSMPEKDTHLHTFCLLISQQIHAEKSTQFCRYAIKLLDEIAIDEQSNIEVSYDPFCEKLIVHHVHVIRDGQKIDKLVDAKLELVQTEDDREKRIYDGELSWMAFLEDIRVGDIIDVAYSIGKNNELPEPYVHALFGNQVRAPVAKIFNRFIADVSRNIKVNKIGFEGDIKVNEIEPSLREWVIESHDVKAIEGDEYVPDWFEVRQRVEFSSYPDWNSVAKIKSQHFHLAEEYNTKCSDEMLELLAGWGKSYQEDEEKVIAVTRFVQDKIRYLYLTNKNEIMLPNDPHTTFKRRFGDCKDKTQLLRFLLRQMGIDSTPVLVNTHRGRGLNQSLPMPIFDHVVLQVSLKGKSYLIDATNMLQGGSLENSAFPNYGYGLPLKEDQEELVVLPKEKNDLRISIVSRYDLSNLDAVLFVVNSHYSGRSADDFRIMCKQDGEQVLLKRYEWFYQQYYEGLSSSEPLVVVDDRRNNSIDVTEKYVIKNFKTVSKGVEPSSIFPATLHSHLLHKPELTRTFLYAIPHPVYIKEEAIVTGLDSYTEPTSFETCACTVAKFQRKISAEQDHLNIVYEYESLADYVTVEDLPAYLEFLDQSLEKIELSITLPEPTISRNPIYALLVLSLFLFLWIRIVLNHFKEKEDLSYEVSV